MTIKQRILAGHLAITSLLLLLAVYGIRRLGEANQGRSWGLESGQDVRDVESLSLALPDIFDLKRLWTTEHDPAYQKAAAERLDQARKPYQRLRGRRDSPA